MVRFSKLVGDLLAGRVATFEEAALLNGYYDISHAYRDAVRFWGHSVTESNVWDSPLNLNML